MSGHRCLSAVELYLLDILVLTLPVFSPIGPVATALQLHLGDEAMAFFVYWPALRCSPVGLILLLISVATKLQTISIFYERAPLRRTHHFARLFARLGIVRS